MNITTAMRPYAMPSSLFIRNASGIAAPYEKSSLFSERVPKDMRRASLRYYYYLGKAPGSSLRARPMVSVVGKSTNFFEVIEPVVREPVCPPLGRGCIIQDRLLLSHAFYKPRLHPLDAPYDHRVGDDRRRRARPPTTTTPAFFLLPRPCRDDPLRRLLPNSIVFLR